MKYIERGILVMNVYDQAHELARTLKQSEEYQALLKVRERLDQDPNNREMLVDFRKHQWEIEEERALGKEVPDERVNQMEQLAKLVSLNPTLKDYLSVEFVFARLMTDVQKILSDSLSEWFDAAEDMFNPQD